MKTEHKKTTVLEQKKWKLIFTTLHPHRRKEKIQGTYFKICALYFKISQTYFLLPVGRLKEWQTKKAFFRSTYFYKGTSTGKGCLVRSFPMLCDWWKTGVRFSLKKFAAHSFLYWLIDDIDLLLCLCLMWNSLIYSCISLFCALWYWILHLTFL